MTNSNEADARWRGITRPYSSADVERVRGSLRIEHTLARRGAEKLWQLLQNEDYVAALGAPEGDLCEWLAGGSGRESCRPNVSRPKFVSRKQRAGTR
jgi:hypothetical protein